MFTFWKIFFFFVFHALLSSIGGFFISDILRKISKPSSTHRAYGEIADMIASIYVGIFIASVIIGVVMYFLFLG